MNRASVHLIIQGIGSEELAAHDPQPLTAAIQDKQESLGYRLVAEIEEYLSNRNVDPSFRRKWKLPSYHLVEVFPQKNVFELMGQIYQAFSDQAFPELFVQHVEPDIALQLTAKIPSKIGTSFSLTTTKSSHSDYKSDLKIPDASNDKITGEDVKIAVLDTGVEPTLSVKSWHDMTDPPQSTQMDKNGHGTAMAMIIADIAFKAEIHAVRVTQSGLVYVWELIAGLETAVYDVGANIVNMSLGLEDIPSGNCGICGGQGNNRSFVLKRFFDNVSNAKTTSGAPDPIFLAAVGNKGGRKGFFWPAAFTNTVAIGAVTKGKTRPSFSNTGTNKAPPRYFLCPGGDTDSNDDVCEWVGEGNDGGTTTCCVGTSASTAYAAAVLALHREYRHKNGKTTLSSDILDGAQQVAESDVTNEQSKKIRLVYGK
ncbi:MAG: S8/S53 family peptidase [Verrucomicrobia bacterium]|nr:S8/S53 family peptidase [Verrucomicrobiota bacterium]